MARLRTPWVKPVSVDPAHFVNRASEVARMERILGDLVAYKQRHELVLVGGDRGIGKSIFCRAVMDRVAKAHPGAVLPLVVDSRMTDADRLVRRCSEALCDRARAFAPILNKGPEWIQLWVDPLAELAYADRIQRGASSVSGREFGAGTDLSGGLWGILQGKFNAQWKEKRELGQRTESTLDVSTEIRAEAIRGMLGELAKDICVLLFFDDLDQAVGMDQPESAKAIFRMVVDLAPAITIIHLRSEVKFPDVRREHDVQVELGPLNPAELEQILKRRLDGALEDDRRLAESVGGWAPLRQLMGASGNPLVMLRWIATLILQSDDWPPPAGWSEDRALAELAIRASAAPDSVLGDLRRLGQILDRLNRADHILESELLEGRRALDASAPGERLEPAVLERLKRHELIMQVDRFDPSLGLRLDALLELIRPSVAARVRGG